MKLYNTASRSLEDFEPLSSREVKIYTCGLTVYDQPHIGNWVPYIYWDVLARALTASGYKLNRVQNITDVGHLTSDEDTGEDKMLTSAERQGLSAWEIADKYTRLADHEAYVLLGLLRPDHMPKATDYITQQIEFVKQLEAKGCLYKLPDGLYFDTSQVSNYGQLARLDTEGLRPGARVAERGKKNPTDFAVWKFSPAGKKRDMQWESPWGTGFPGWHLECSALARHFLGDQFDIHTGGIDHIPVHHTNEIVQTEALTGRPMAKLWLHANHIKVNGTKMSKSLGNVYSLQDVANKGFDLRAFKLLVLSKHYRTEGNFTWEIMNSAQNRLGGWQAAADLRWQLPGSKPEAVELRLLECLQDDLNTPAAVALIDDYIEKFTSTGLSANLGNLNKLIDEVDKLLGLNLKMPDITDEQKLIIKDRELARKNQDFKKADEHRGALKKQGIELNDTDDGPIWRRHLSG